MDWEKEGVALHVPVDIFVRNYQIKEFWRM